MEKKVLKFLLVSLLIFSLVGLNFILVGEQVVHAIYEELETQNTQTNNSNIVFDAYYKEMK